MPGLRLSVQWFRRGNQAILWVDAEESLYICVLRDHVPARTSNVYRTCILKSYTVLLFLISAMMLLPDRVDSNVGVLGVDSSHNGAGRRVFLYLKRITGSYEHRRLVCILHWNLQKHKRLHFIKQNCDIYRATHSNKHNLLVVLPGINIHILIPKKNDRFALLFGHISTCVPLWWLHPYRAPKRGTGGQCGG